MDGETSARSAQLWGAQVLQKLGVVAFSFALGRAGGAEAVGVMAAVLALTWLLSTLAMMGLPDRMVFAAAESARTGLPMREGGLHSTTLLSLGLLTLGLLPLAPAMGGGSGEALAGFAQCLVLGAGLQGLSAPTFCALRGLGRPGWEVVALVPMSGVLAGCWFVADLQSLGLAWAVAGGIQLIVALFAARSVPGLWPSRPVGLARMVRLGWPYLGFGVGAWLVGNVDLLMARALWPASDVGTLQVGSMVLRAGASGAWVLATLSLHRLDAQLPWPRIAVAWVLIGGGVAAGSIVGLPLLAWGHDLSAVLLLPTAEMAAAWAPVTMAAMLLLPICAARRMDWTLRSIGLGLSVAAVSGWLLSSSTDVEVCILAAGLGQLVVAIGLVIGLLTQRSQVDIGAGTPGVGLGSIGSEATPVAQLSFVDPDQPTDASDERGGSAVGD